MDKRQHGLGCLIIASLIFLGIGIGVNFLANVPDRQQPAAERLPKWTIVVFSLGFIAPGLAMLALAVPVRYAQQRTTELRVNNPDRPWMWRSDWASAHISDKTGSEAAFLWIITLLFVCLTLPCTFSIYQNWAHRHRAVDLVGFVVPAICIFFAVLATRSTLQGFRFGKAVFELHTLPAMVGNSLKGTIRIDRPINFPNGVFLRLACFRLTRIKADGHVIQTVVWDSEQMIERISATALTTDIPVFFGIPSDAPPCGDYSRDDQVLWRLECRSASAHIHYRVGFVVPVFPAGVVPAPEQTPEITPAPTAPAMKRPRDNGISIVPLGTNGLQIDFAPMRNYRPALWPAFTTLVFGGIAFVLSQIRIPAPVVALPGLVGIVAALVLFRSLLGRTRITARADSLTISDNLKLLRTPIRFNIKEIEDLRTKVAFQLFDDPFYRLVVVRRGMSPYTIRAVIASKRDAEWLANEIKKHLRLNADGDAVTP